MIKGGDVSPPAASAVPEEEPQPRLITAAAPAQRDAEHGQPELSTSTGTRQLPQPSAQRCVRLPCPGSAPLQQPKRYDVR